MPTRNPRLMVVLEPPLYHWIKETAKKEGLSLSLMIRDMIKDAYQEKEDLYWSIEGEKRLTTFSHKTTISHGNLKQRLHIKS